MNKIRNININKSKKYKLRRICVVLTAVFTMGTMVIGARALSKKQQANNFENAYSYIQMIDEQNNNSTYNTLTNNANCINDLIQYIELSEKLHKLNLPTYTGIEENSKPLLADEIEVLINKFNALEDNDLNKSNIGDMLARQERLVNQRVFNGYSDTADYLLSVLKIIVAKQYNKNPNRITLENIVYEKADNTCSCNLIDGTEKTRIFSSDIPELFMILDVNQLQKNLDRANASEQQTYNNERNKMLKDKINSATDEIKEIYDENFSSKSF